MRCIIAGSRTLGGFDLDCALLACPFTSEITTVVCGCARGIDRCGEEWAQANDKLVDYYAPDWAKHGKKAGFLRNQEMALHADALIAVWDGKSRGTKNMIELAWKYKLKVYVWPNE